MPNRTAYAGLAADGDVYTAANHARMPGGWIGYGEAVANATVTNGTLAVVTLAGVQVGPSRRIKVSGFGTLQVEAEGTEGDGMQAHLRLLQDGVVVAVAAYRGRSLFANPDWAPLAPWAVLTPSAGAHTYALEIRSLSSQVELTLLTTSHTGMAARLLVEDVGPAT